MQWKKSFPVLVKQSFTGGVSKKQARAQITELQDLISHKISVYLTVTSSYGSRPSFDNNDPPPAKCKV